MYPQRCQGLSSQEAPESPLFVRPVMYCAVSHRSWCVLLSWEKQVDVDVVVRDAVKGDVTFGINGRSMQTIVYGP